jgi:hypothetical protein
MRLTATLLLSNTPAEQCTFRLMAILRRVQNEAGIDIMYPLRIIKVRSKRSLS